MVIEDTLSHIFSCEPYPPPIMAMHLHLPHTLYCLTRVSGENYLLPRVGLSDNLFAIEPFTAVYQLTVEIGRVLGLMNFVIIGLTLFFSFTNLKRKGGPKRVAIVVILALVAVMIGETLGTPYLFE